MEKNLKKNKIVPEVFFIRLTIFTYTYIDINCIYRYIYMNGFSFDRSKMTKGISLKKKEGIQI